MKIGRGLIFSNLQQVPAIAQAAEAIALTESGLRRRTRGAVALRWCRTHAQDEFGTAIAVALRAAHGIGAHRLGSAAQSGGRLSWDWARSEGRTSSGALLTWESLPPKRATCSWRFARFGTAGRMGCRSIPGTVLPSYTHGRPFSTPGQLPIRKCLFSSAGVPHGALPGGRGTGRWLPRHPFHNRQVSARGHLAFYRSWSGQGGRSEAGCAENQFGLCDSRTMANRDGASANRFFTLRRLHIEPCWMSWLGRSGRTVVGLAAHRQLDQMPARIGDEMLETCAVTATPPNCPVN